MYKAFFLLIFVIHLASGQTDQLSYVRNISMPDNPVFSITQDNMGFVWFGSKNGLHRYDSYETETFLLDPTDTTSLLSNWVWSVHSDKKGNLWVGTSQGLNLWVPDCYCFRAIELPQKDATNQSISVRKIFEDSSGNIWVGTNHGLYKSTSSSLTEFKKSNLGYGLRQSTDFDIKEIVENGPGELYVSSQYGLFMLEDDKFILLEQINSLIFSEYQKEETRALYLDKEAQVLWIGTQSESIPLIRYDLSTNQHTIVEIPGSTESNSIRTIVQLDKTLWIGTMDGLFSLDLRTQKIETLLIHQSIRDIMKDKNGAIWAATYDNGVNYLSDKAPPFQLLGSPFSVNAEKANKREGVITAMVEISPDEIWIGTEYGIKMYRPSDNSFPVIIDKTKEKSLSNNRIKSLANDKNGHLWIGTFNGLNRLNLSTYEIEEYLLNPNQENPNWNEIRDIIEIDNAIWVGTNGGGIFELKSVGSLPTISQFSDHFNRSANFVNTLHLSNDQTIWVGSNAGLAAINPMNKTFRLIGNNNYLFQNKNITSITSDDRKNLWLGTERNGLIYFNPSTLRSTEITTIEGLNTNIIKSIELDDDQNLWITTKEGLSKIVMSDVENFDSLSYEIYDFPYENNVGKYTFSPNSSEKLSNGDIVFGTHKGMIKFSPNKVFTQHKNPKVWIRDISINQERITTSTSLRKTHGSPEPIKKLKLKHDESGLSFHFSAIDYDIPNELYYSYLLSGINDEWQIIEKQRTLNFNYLPPGIYNLKLKSSNSKQSWGEEFTSLELIILPPYYKSSLAFIFYAIFILTMLYLFYQYSSKWHKLKNQLVIEELNKNKEHELHQLKSEFFINITHELKTPLTLILAPVEDLLSQKIENANIRNRLKMVKRNADKVLRLINQIVEVRKIETSTGFLEVREHNLVEFVREIASGFNEISRIKSIDLNINSRENDLPLWFDRNKLDVAITNLLANAFKYTKENGKINVSIARDSAENGLDTSDYIYIIIEDNGKGIAEEDIPYLFDRFHHISGQNKRLSIGDGIGLDLSKKIIDRHQGNIQIQSMVEKENTSGLTRITVALKTGKEHFNEQEFEQGELKSNTEEKAKMENIVRDDYELIDPKAGENEEILPSDHVILVVTNDTEFRNTIRTLFPKYHIYEAADGLEGWKLVLDIVPMLVITSTKPTTIDGYELCSRIKIDERTCHIPVIIRSDRLDEVGVKIHDEFPADHYMNYDIRSEDFVQKVSYLIEQRERIRKQFARKSIMKPEQISSYDEKMLNNAVAYIENNISDSNLSIERISREIGISRVHFYRKIKALLNLSPNEFLRTYRIRKAGQLLEQKKINVSEVRMMVGFSDPDYFRSCFKKEFGLNPSEFAKKSTHS